jgi:hypothetical protein
MIARPIRDDAFKTEDTARNRMLPEIGQGD